MSPLATVPISKYETRGTNYLHLQQGGFGARGLFLLRMGSSQVEWTWAGLPFAHGRGSTSRATGGKNIPAVFRRVAYRMNSAINFSRFAYKATKPRLTFYQPGDKENRPDGRNPPSPINAHPETTGERHYTPTSIKKLSVVPETPDDEWPMKRANNSRAPAMASGKRKRWRVPSSSEEEIESECESRDVAKGDPRETKCGLFSSTVVSKRQKRSGESTYPINKCALDSLTIIEDTKTETESEHQTKNTVTCDDISTRGNTGLHFRGRISQRNIIDLCTDSESECSQSDNEGDITVSAKCKVSEVNSDSETENDVQTHVRRPRPKPARRVPSPTSDGWFTRRGRSNKERKPKPSSALDSTPDIEVDVCRLRELFPQHSNEYLREILNVCSDVDGAIAHILASDGTVLVLTQWNLSNQDTEDGRKCPD